jgi:hypothetical protein
MWLQHFLSRVFSGLAASASRGILAAGEKIVNFFLPTF